VSQLLVKLFVKEYENTNDAKVRTSYGVMASIVGVICNVLLFATKLIIGTLINSISITADAFNNLSDAASSVISFIGVKLAEKPADKEHPFGHGRFEYIAALVVSFLILFVGCTLFKDSFNKVLHPEPVGFSWIMVIILGASMLVKVWLSIFNYKLGTRINSTVMKATAADARNDVMVTAATIFSIVVGKLTGVTIDGWVGLVVSVIVLLAGINIAKDTLMPLLGEAVDKEVYDNITKKVEGYPGIVGSHDLIIHNYGPMRIMATIHAEVSNDSNIETIHETIDQIERDVYKDMSIALVIHMDPVEMKDESVLEKKEMVKAIISSIDSRATIHDFHLVHLEKYTNLTFDLVVPHSYSGKDEENLLMEVTDRISDIDEQYQCIIAIENSFIAE